MVCFGEHPPKKNVKLGVCTLIFYLVREKNSLFWGAPNHEFFFLVVDKYVSLGIYKQIFLFIKRDGSLSGYNGSCRSLIYLAGRSSLPEPNTTLIVLFFDSTKALSSSSNGSTSRAEPSLITMDIIDQIMKETSNKIWIFHGYIMARLMK